MRRAGGSQRVERRHRDRQPGLHIERARSLQAPLTTRDRHARERPDRPDRVEVPEQQHGAAVAADLRADMVAARVLRQRLDARAQPSQAARQFVAAPIDRRLVGARRLEPRERLGRLDELRELGFAIGQQRIHKNERRKSACGPSEARRRRALKKDTRETERPALRSLSL